MQDRVIAFGDVNVDLVTTLPRKGADGRAVAPRTEVFPGGTVGNTAAGLARLGCPVSFAGKIGNDAFGRFIRRDFEKEGVDTSFLWVEEEGFTVMIMAFIDEAGERHITVWPPRDGAHTKLRFQELPPAFWNQAGWIHSSGISLRQDPTRTATLKGLEEARRRGIPVSFDLNMRVEFFGWSADDRKNFLAAAFASDYLLGSVTEEILPLAEAAKGAPLAGDAEGRLREALELLGAGGRTIIARRGPHGTILYRHGEIRIIPAYRVNITDALGAGDAFNSGFITAMWERREVAEAIRWGNAAASLNLTRPGARGTPTRGELISFLNAPDREELPAKPLG